MFQNLKKIFTYTPSLITWIVTTILAFFLWYSYSAIEYVSGNYSTIYAYTDTFFSWMMILLFPLMLAGIVYKSLVFGQRNIEKKKGILGLISGIVSTMITGAVCCGVSLLSVLGLTSVIALLEVLPYDGLELKGLAIVLLLYATVDLYKNLETCKVR